MSATEERTAYVGAPSSAARTSPSSPGAARTSTTWRVPGTVSMVVVRSPYAHARVTSIDLEAARKAEGVVAVFSAADLAGGLEGAAAVRLARDRRHEEPAALPAHRRRALPGGRGRGRDRRDPSRRRWTRRSSSRSTTSRSTRSSTSRRRSRTARRSSTRTSARTSATSGGSTRTRPDRRSRTRTSSSRARYRQPRLIPNAIEPRAVLAVPGPTGEVTLYSATQVPHILRSSRSGESRDARDEAAGRRARRRRRLRLEARRLCGGVARRRARAPARSAGEVDGGALRELPSRRSTAATSSPSTRSARRRTARSPTAGRG